MPLGKSFFSRGKAKDTEKKEGGKDKAGNSKTPGRTTTAVSLGNRKQEIKERITKHLSTSALSSPLKRRRSDNQEEEANKVRRTNSLHGARGSQGTKGTGMTGKEERIKAVEGKVEELEKAVERWKEEERAGIEARLAEKDEKIAALEARIKQLEEFLGKDVRVEGGNKGEENGEGVQEESEQQGVWAKILGRKMKTAVEKTLEDRRIQKKIVRVTDEVKDKKERERNMVIRGWREAKDKGLGEEELKDPEKVANFIVGETMKVKMEIEGAEWMGLEERKVLVVKMKKREDKANVMKERARLRGTKIYLEDDLTAEERRIQGRLLEIRKKIKEKDDKMLVWVRNGRIAVNKKWYSLEEAETNFREE